MGKLAEAFKGKIAKRIANWESEIKCPMCEAGIPLKKGK